MSCEHWKNFKYETRGYSLRMNGRTTGLGKLYLWHADRNNNPKGSAINLPLLNLLV